MRRGDAISPGEVGDGARHLEDAIIGAGRKRKLLHRLLEQVTQRGVEDAELLELRWEHPGIGRQRGAIESAQLHLPGLLDAFADGAGGFAGLIIAELGDGQGRGLDVEVDAVEQRAG